jgi:hypothetical protein
MRWDLSASERRPAPLAAAAADEANVNGPFPQLPCTMRPVVLSLFIFALLPGSSAAQGCLQGSGINIERSSGAHWMEPGNAEWDRAGYRHRSGTAMVAASYARTRSEDEERSHEFEVRYITPLAPFLCWSMGSRHYRTDGAKKTELPMSFTLTTRMETDGIEIMPEVTTGAALFRAEPLDAREESEIALTMGYKSVHVRGAITRFGESGRRRTIGLHLRF